MNLFSVISDDNGRPGRYAMSIEYNGSAYHGWQAQQPGVSSVQETLEAAISKVANEPIRVLCSGRTDTGVHGCSQIVHFDSVAIRSSKAWVYGCNANLPNDIVVRWAQPVSDDFHARYSATARRYRYVIYNNRIRPALMHDQLTWHDQYLDADKMHEAVQSLLGENDFSSFRAAGCQSNTPWREIQEAKVFRQGQLVVLEIKANAFLHHMIRNIVGVLLPIGEGVKPVEWTKELLQVRDRTKAGVTAPPNGLYFVEAIYPEQFALPVEPLGPSFLNLI
ncbi:tRNA pseudouridine38-40 synthase [Oceanospirillum multiglobuliferum]|uniref:tRNA pseudouridine synthase A n=1 Tax=Oceanospirillum multiglobuliferum TaxID=64969 RepID=A0A1T4LK25_9GAMM|nr:tRNA pseudouridine(38-40) synthase TruA [Oceanospirillum multiglobuliferum]OPX56628.1 tRNA pseudouridine(38-40) synthase TruA [Oceanospirillum multiglobuliferum]SJZ55122.1 tRNA pseudouridine38-40 synthase [Oceanospirillum multiglobuliferum]